MSEQLVQDVFENEHQIAEYKEVFKMFDKDDDGIMPIEDLGSVLRYFGHNLTEVALQALIAAANVGADGTVDFSQFMTVMAYKEKEAGTAEEVLEAFRVFDKSANGFISTAELRHIMTTLGEKLTEEEMDEMIRDADMHGDGQIYYDEFVHMMFAK